MLPRTFTRTTLRRGIRLASTSVPAPPLASTPSPSPSLSPSVFPPPPASTETPATATPPLPDLPPAPAPLQTSAPPTPVIKQPVGAWRGGLIGFLLGLTALGSYGYFLLLSDYEKASRQLVESVKNLESSTSLISSQLERIAELESRLKSVESTQVSSKRLESFRNEYKKLSDSQHLDLIDLKAHVWSIEQDLVNLEKKNEAERRRSNQTVTLRI
ncbi:hypothetical protein JCM5350_005186 [Sporobolomyces pararoseus]